MKTRNKKLSLKKETLTNLSNSELQQVAGGLIKPTKGADYHCVFYPGGYAMYAGKMYKLANGEYHQV